MNFSLSLSDVDSEFSRVATDSISIEVEGNCHHCSDDESETEYHQRSRHVRIHKYNRWPTD